jgi:ribosomal protein S18 acetylase RimI-like enzyme
MMHCEGKVRQQGASSLTLHVFSRNARARALYASEGFDEELVRAIKWLD